MQQEDDIRGLAKIMEFMRAISILFVVMNIYWFCYYAFREWGINISIVDKILLNFARTAGLFRNLLYTKLFAVVFLALSCLATKGVKEEKITWNKIYLVLWLYLLLSQLVDISFTITVGSQYSLICIYIDNRLYPFADESSIENEYDG